jgi:hypothetical protein
MLLPFRSLTGHSLPCFFLLFFSQEKSKKSTVRDRTGVPFSRSQNTNDWIEQMNSELFYYEQVGMPLPPSVPSLCFSLRAPCVVT